MDVNNGRIYAISSDGTDLSEKGGKIYYWHNSGSINLEMAVTSFISNQSSPQLIGDAGTTEDPYVWKDGDDLTFTIGYNQAPDSASISELGSPSTWSSNIVVPSPYTSATSGNSACLTPTHDVRWPTSVGANVTFKVTAVKSGQSNSTRQTSVNFQNEFCIGVSTESNHATFAASSASIRALGTKLVQSTKTVSYTHLTLPPLYSV